MATLFDCLHGNSNEPAIIFSGPKSTIVSQSSLAKNVAHIQEALEKRGIREKRVAIVIPIPHLFAVAFFSTTLQSCIAAPLNQNFKVPEFEYYYQDIKPELVVLADSDVEKSSAAYTAAQSAKIPIAILSSNNDDPASVEISFPDDTQSESNGSSDESNSSKPTSETPALLLHTSGTTGAPKSVLLTHGNLATSMKNIAQHYKFEASDRTPVIMPLFHIHGIVAALLTPLYVGSAVIFPAPPLSGLTPSFLKDAAEHGATWYTATPTLHRLILKMKDGEKKANFRFVRSCSSPLDAGLLEKLEERFDCPVVEAYAMTEAAHQMTSNPVSREKRRIGSVGMPTGIEMKTLDDDGKEVEVGEVCIRGQNVMGGYLNNDEANTKGFVDSQDGKSRWFRTGDQGKIDGEGYLTLTGRLKELINKGGEKISPVEIDGVVNKHESISEAVAFAMPDEMYGEEVGVAVVLNEGQEVEEKVLKKWIAERITQMKVPKKVFFVEQIPKTAVGKMQRSLVAKTVLGGTN